MRRVLNLTILFAAVSISATDYYIDYDGGSDSNDGLSKATPFKHHPGMNGWTGSGVTPTAGDNFYFKGGVTWPNSALSLWVNENGTATNRIYLGVDQTWYSGDQYIVWTNGWGNLVTNFNYPVLDAQGTNIVDTRNGFYTDGRNAPLIVSGDYVTIDNIAVTGHTVPTVTGGQNCVFVYSTTGAVLTNMYVHDWVWATATAGSDVGGIYDAGLSTDVSVYNSRIWGPPVENIDTNYITQAGGEHTGAGIEGVDYVYGCDIKHTIQGIWNCQEVFNTAVYEGGNAISSSHENAVNMYGNKTFANGLVRDWGGGTAIYMVPAWSSASGVCLVYNNVVYNTTPISISVSATGIGTGNTPRAEVYNNILVRDGSTFDTGGGGPSGSQMVWYVTNNFSIGTYTTNPDGISDSSSNGTLSAGNNDSMTDAAATTAGLTAANNYKPSSAVTELFNTGVNLSDIFTTDIDGVARPQGGAWDLGAYEFVPAATRANDVTVSGAIRF